MNPRYPVYILSKGRWDSRLTVKQLEMMGVPYHIVVEPQEYEQYAAVIDPAKIIVAPFSDVQSCTPARNLILEHARASGSGWHWQMDDNIKMFHRYQYNVKVPVASGTIFRLTEDFVDQFENVDQAGLNYYMFVARKEPIAPMYVNTRVYSCMLIRNDIPFNFRGKMNEDTDMSLQILKAGRCTILLNQFLAQKAPTQTVKGGLADTVYKAGDRRLAVTEVLLEHHSDVVTITEKWGRYQHHVDYRRFRENELKLKPGVEVPRGTDEHGMVLEQLIDGEWVRSSYRGGV